MMRQPVGVGVERGVAERASSNTTATASGVRAACAANSAGKVADGNRLRRVVPAPQDGVALGRLQDRQAAERPLRHPRPRPPAAGSAARQRLHVSPARTGRADSRAATAASRPAARSAPADNASHRGPGPRRAERRQPRRRKPGAVDRIVLEHQQRVEQIAHSRPPAGSRPAPDAGAPSAATGCPGSAAAAPTAAARGGSCSRSGSVLMNSPTMCSTPASSAGRPATVTPNTTSSRPLSRPSRMPQAACITVFSVSACSRACRFSAALSAALERQHDLLGRQRLASGLPRRQPRALLETGQRLPPRRKPRRTVLPGDEAEIIAVRRHPRQRRRAATAAHKASSSSRTRIGADQPSISR